MVFYFSYVLTGLFQTLITLNYFKTHIKSHYDETRQTLFFYQLKKNFLQALKRDVQLVLRKFPSYF